ncbi:hypothetical protein ASG52_15900 [Methylobacterium sp. Leaf456]|nr:hypothetical protein ASG52_15900 [Methylobacterium sp. Leaf456]
MVHALQAHARSRPDAVAIHFVCGEDEGEVLTYGCLDRRARALGERLRLAVEPDALALLPMRSDAPSVIALVACLYAGVACAPVPLPGRNGSVLHLRAIAAASGAAVAVVPPDASHLAQALPGMRIMIEDPTTEPSWSPEAPSGSNLAIVQYTSGSAAEPKGVLLSHANIAANLAMLRNAFAVGPDDVYASWLPLFHDMGLAMLLMPLHFGVRGHLMPPLTFLRRPALWLKQVARSGATITGAPNFAYAMCSDRVGDDELENLDLGRLRLAFCGAEPVRLATMRRFAQRFAATGFRAEALYPCYGMAEAVTFVSGGHLRGSGRANPGDEIAPVSCGRPALGTHVAIVDPATGALCADGVQGEIWVAGPQVGAGYREMAEATRTCFGARLPAFPGLAFLRTGDLGFLARGDLTITGRLKDIIIYRGANIHAADIEAAVATCHEGFGEVGAAFAWTVEDVEQIVLVHEAARGLNGPTDSRMRRAALDAVAFHHGVRLHDLVLVRPGGIPKTTSGKVRRDACRALYVQDALRSIPLV